MTADLATVSMPGQVWGLAAANPAGPVYVTSYAGCGLTSENLSTTVLTAVDLTGATIWQRSFPGHPFPPRVDADGTVWMAHHDGGSPPCFAVTAISPGGAVVGSVIPSQEASEHLGAVVRMPDGFCAVWLPAAPRRQAGNGVARLARHSDTGDTIWSTPLSLGAISFPGVVEASDDTNWQVRPKGAWTPTTLEVGHRQPLLVAGDRILAEIADYSGGIGVCTFLDTATGQTIAASEPAPYDHKAIAGPGRFLIGTQGYGAFTSTLYDHDGQPVQTWPSQGMMLIDQHGTIRGPETRNDSGRSCFRILNLDGSMRDGSMLTGYYTTYPALDAHGTTVLWRDSKLMATDADLHQRELFTMTDNRAVMSRILLLDHGITAFALDHELLIFRGTGLAPLADGPWPCADGNLHGNPAIAL